MTSYRLLALATALLALHASAALSDSATLQQGIQALKSGNADQAIKLFSAELAASDRNPEQRAKAFYLRAKAYYAAKQPALAMNDVASALWFNKLSSADAADAATIRGQALAEAMTSAARAPAQAPPTPLIEKTPSDPAPTETASIARPARSEAAAEPEKRRAPTPAPVQHEPARPKAPPQPFTTTTQQHQEPITAASATQPEQGPAAPSWTQSKVKRETLATVTVPPEQQPARATTAIPPAQTVVRESIDPPASASASSQREETDGPSSQVLPWQTGPVRAARVEQSQPEPNPAAASPPWQTQPQPASDIVTGTAGRAETAPPAATPQTGAAQAVARQAAAESPPTDTNPQPENTEAAATNTTTLMPSLSPQGFAAMFASDDPMAADIARADDLQRARYERIRQMNAARNAGAQ